MKVTVRSKLPPSPTIQQVFDLLLNSRASIRNSPLAISDYLSPPHPSTLSLIDFGFEKEYIDQAMDMIWRCHPAHPDNVAPDKPIIVYTDYDADGITGGAILWETLHTLGFKAFPYTPNRITEGYGFSTQGLDFVKEEYDPALIISVDHGIVADAQVTYAKEKLGIPIIVTDHHHRQEEKVPKKAVAIFHIPALSGSGTAYYVAKETMKYQIFNFQFSITKNVGSNSVELGTRNLEFAFKSDYVGIAAIGTIADLVPLQGPSRSFAYHGLTELTRTQRPGLVALKKVADHIGKTVTTYEVGFLLAPRINASGRLDDALDALRLLCTKDTVKAQMLATKLDRLNRERQDMVKHAVEEAVTVVNAHKDTDGNLPKILIVHQFHISESSQPDRLNTCMPNMWHEGIIGLIASKLCDKYHRPTIVLTLADNGKSRIANSEKNSVMVSADSVEHSRSNRNLSNHKTTKPARKVELGTWNVCKASCRSIPGFHMTDYLTLHKDLLIKFGGHEMAAGFSIGTDKLDEFKQKSQEYANTHITDEMLERTITIDCELPLSLASIEFAEMVERLAPFGMGNPKPLFVTRGAIVNVQTMGKDQKHARFRLIQGIEGLDFVAFGKAEEILATQNADTPYDVVFTLDINRWNGSEKVQGKFISIVTPDSVIIY